MADIDKKLKIMYLDIETTPNLEGTWDLYMDHRPYQALLKEKSILSVAWKWEGEKDCQVVSVLDSKRRFKKDPWDDFIVCKRLRQHMIDADIIIAHNGDKFDIRFINARLAANNMRPLPQLCTLDTYREAKRALNLNCYRLDYLGWKLLGRRKIKMDMDNWINIINPWSPVELRTKWMEDMITYNINDVHLLQEIYKYLDLHFNCMPPILSVTAADGLCCPQAGCGSTNYREQGYYTPKNGTRAYKRYECKDCGRWFRDTTASKKALGRGL